MVEMGKNPQSKIQNPKSKIHVMVTRDWRQFALLLIDVQEDFWSQELEQAFPAFRENVSRLLSFCRE